MKNLRERWRGLTVLGVVAFAAVCMTVAPAPSFADIAGGGGGGGPITEWCSDGRPKTGLVRCEDGNLRYFDPETGAMVTNQWHNEYEAVWYYFGADGIAVSGWQSIGGDKYYFYPESHDMAYGRVQIDGKNYFLNTPGANADGRMQHSGWLYDSIYGKWFYATSSGELLTGWHNIGGTWYYFDEYGVMLTGWINVSGTWYLSLIHISRCWLTGSATVSMSSMPRTWRTSYAIWCCTMRSGCWVRTAARCLLPLPQRLPVLLWVAMLRLHNVPRLLPLWCARRLPVRPPMPVRAKSSCSITTS